MKDTERFGDVPVVREVIGVDLEQEAAILLPVPPPHILHGVADLVGVLGG